MIRNLRDLGGLTGADGRKIKKNIFIRSAMLNNIDQNDIDWIHEVNIKKIYDLRTHTEVARKPDMDVPGAEYIHFYLQDENQKGGLTVKGVRALMVSAKSEVERLSLLPDMKSLYAAMVTDDYSRARFVQLIREMVAYEDGAILFHCTSGKDRTGMTAAMLCSILGVSREDIFDDYLRSLEHAEWEAAIMREEFIDEGASPELADKLKQFFMLDREYLETFFYEIAKYSGSVENYIRDVIGLDDAAVNKFRNRVLE